MNGALALQVLALATMAGITPVELDPDSCKAYVGVYRLDNRALVSIFQGEAGENALFFSESEGERGGPLRPVSGSSFTAGPTLDSPEPIEFRATFLRDRSGAVTGLSWQRALERPRTARRAIVVSEEVRIPSGEAVLAATLTKPCTPGPHPAIVLLPSGGASTRSQYGSIPSAFASLGVACLLYDKRGCGGSTGRYHDFITIDQLARDAEAALRILRSRAEIDSIRIGLSGVSQAGWVLALVASRTRVAFIVLSVAPTLSVAENGLYEIDNNLRIAGRSEEEVAASRRLNEQFNRMVLTRGQGWDSLRVALDKSRGEPWFAQAGLPDSLPLAPGPANLRWVDRLREYMDFDPIPLWEHTRVPILALYAGHDRNVPGAASAAALRAALTRAGNPDFIVELFPDADHWMWQVTDMRTSAERRAKVAGLTNRTHRWVVDHARPTNAESCVR